MFSARQQIGPYELIRKLGTGGFGEVWLAKRHSAIAAPEVAVKLPLDDQPDMDAITREAQLWVSAGGHPNVLPVVEASIYNGQVAIVSEYADGGTLTQWLARNGGKAPSTDAAVKMAVGILAGLAHLHARGIIHRDLKPDNVLMQRDTPRLTDFGISRAMKSTNLTRIASGTPAYMPPEAFDGHYSPQSDLWSVGIILYRMLTGQLPFPQPDMMSLWKAIAHAEPPVLSAALPKELRQCIARSLQKEPSARFRSAEEMTAALLIHHSPRRVATPSAAPVHPSSFNPHPSNAPTAPAPKPIEQTRRSFLGYGVAATGAVALGGYVVWKQSGKGTREGGNGTGGSKAGSGSGGSVGETSSASPPANPKIGDSWTHPKTGIELVFIPPGDFLMGDSDRSDNPRHTVKLSAYWISRTVVTVEQYLKFCNDPETHREPPKAPDFNKDWENKDHPIVNVSWDAAQAYCKWAGLLLPSEAQWEKAARGTEGLKYPWGDQFDPSKLQFSKSTEGDAKSTAPVTKFRQGPYDLYDVAGNVWQWCRDAYERDFWKSRPNGEVDPVNVSTNNSGRVLRGGGWNNVDPDFFRAAYRLDIQPTGRGINAGFRVASGP